MEKVSEKSERRRGYRKVRTGVVVSDKMEKTVVVKLSRIKQHERYKKYYRVWKKVKAHDQENACQVGDLVELVETRPLSKDKHWRVRKILRKAE